jgi:hypothetical protein
VFTFASRVEGGREREGQSTILGRLAIEVGLEKEHYIPVYILQVARGGEGDRFYVLFASSKAGQGRAGQGRAGQFGSEAHGRGHSSEPKHFGTTPVARNHETSPPSNFTCRETPA